MDLIVAAVSCKHSYRINYLVYSLMNFQAYQEYTFHIVYSAANPFSIFLEIFAGQTAGEVSKIL